MKKTAKSLFLVLAMVVMIFSLAGCGKQETSSKDKAEEKSSANTLVAKKSESDSEIGNYTETVEISFENDKASKVKVTMDFEEEEKAKNAETMLNYVASISEGIKIERNEKAVIATMEPKNFIGSDELKDEELTKSALEEELKKGGYEIQ